MRIDDLIFSAAAGAVAVETTEDSLCLFFHDGGTFREERRAWRPFLLIDTPSRLDGFGGPFEAETLAGGMILKHRITFPSAAVYRAALDFLKKARHAAVWSCRDLRQLALTSEGLRLFGGMSFPELRRLAFDVTPSPDGGIGAISLADASGWRETLVADGSADGEKRLLEAFVRIVAERDPDVIETHDGDRRQWPLLEARAEACRVPPALGRDRSVPTYRPSRFSVGDRIIGYRRCEIFGRHVIDTLHLALFYDASSRDLDGFDPAELAEHFSLPERSGAGAVIALGNLLEPSYFYQCSILPLSYQELIVRGNGTSLDAMFAAEYLRRGHSLPLPEAPRRFAGALTRADRIGVFRNVWHCDVRSLYPSIILAEHWVPARDELGEFPRLLEALRRFRLEAKDRARTAETPEERAYYQALQSTFKITINSFYGYLGFAQGCFNDYDMAERVTARGREILTGMVDFLTASGAVVIEMDTDGIYFQPPEGTEDPAAFQRRIQSALPDGIEVELDACYRAMFSYKSKNYALLTQEGAVELTGAALKSRGMEPFLRDVIFRTAGALLEGRPGDVPALFAAMRREIESRRIPLAQLAKTEILNDSPAGYKRKLDSGTGRRSAAYELALRSGREFRSGDPVTYYLTGEKAKISVADCAKLLSDAPAERDENTAWYLNKLAELEKNFTPFL